MTWNGKRAAVSLTFDDTLASQLQNAVPMMDRRKVPGTFFAIGNCPEYPLDAVGWRAVVNRRLHEIGSHSVLHKKAATLTPKDCLWEARESKRILENHFDIDVTSFCYPYTDAPEKLQDAVKAAGYKQARGGRVARQNKYVTPGDGVNLLNVPCYHVNQEVIETGQAAGWVMAAIDQRAWLTLMFHAVGDPLGWDNVTPQTFLDFLDFLIFKEKDLWVAPFGTVAEEYRSVV